MWGCVVHVYMWGCVVHVYVWGCVVVHVYMWVCVVHVYMWGCVVYVGLCCICGVVLYMCTCAPIANCAPQIVFSVDAVPFSPPGDGCVWGGGAVFRTLVSSIHYNKR